MDQLMHDAVAKWAKENNEEERLEAWQLRMEKKIERLQEKCLKIEKSIKDILSKK